MNTRSKSGKTPGGRTYSTVHRNGVRTTTVTDPSPYVGGTTSYTKVGKQKRVHAASGSRVVAKGPTHKHPGFGYTGRKDGWTS